VKLGGIGLVRRAPLIAAASRIGYHIALVVGGGLDRRDSFIRYGFGLCGRGLGLGGSAGGGLGRALRSSHGVNVWRGMGKIYMYIQQGYVSSLDRAELLTQVRRE